ncbi:MAG: alkane 1-monooxygenase [Pseudomonadota bacterium]
MSDAADVVQDGKPWRDRKRYLWPLGLVITLLPPLGGLLAERTGLTVFWYLLPIYAYGLVPLLDAWLGEDRHNPPESQVPSLERDPFYRAVLIAYLPAQYACFAWGVFTFVNGTLGWTESLGLILSLGLIGGGGINVAHELGHKPSAVSGWLAKLALMQTAYGHFYVEHNRGHHVRVATREDPASARYGETYYGFWVRTVFGGFASAWRLEQQRLGREGCGAWHWRNQVLQGLALTLALFVVTCLWLGAAVLPLLLAQAVIGFSLLEGVNYIEHYGLLRRRDGEGRLERVQPRHSWNSNHVMSNLMLYHLQRHSDHHAHWSRSYQALRHQADAPALPAGYTAMLLVALVPPLWRRIMDPRLLAHSGGDPSRLNAA